MSNIEQEQVRTAIQQLPVEFREIIILREYEELSYQEIAAVLECPLGTVMSRWQEHAPSSEICFPPNHWRCDQSRKLQVAIRKPEHETETAAGWIHIFGRRMNKLSGSRALGHASRSRGNIFLLQVYSSVTRVLTLLHRHERGKDAE